MEFPPPLPSLSPPQALHGVSMVGFYGLLPGVVKPFTMHLLSVSCP